ncbi:MAG: type I-E CRISPR-associated protein Cse2/CasB [bacterium]
MAAWAPGSAAGVLGGSGVTQRRRPDDRQASPRAPSASPLLAALAETHDLGGSTPFGQALQQAGLSEDRFVRLLDAPDNQRADALLKVVGVLARSRTHFNPFDLVRFALTTEPAAAERLRLRLARDFYRAARPAAPTQES